jgi:hypothetical protein
MDLNRLLQLQPPWLHLLIATESEACDLRTAAPDAPPARVIFRMIRGHKAQTKSALFDEFAAALQFPHYFGENWDAFVECLNDLAWLPGDAYVLLVLRSIHLLDKEPADELQCMLTILQNAGDEWSKPPYRRPFHVLLQCTDKEESSFRSKLKPAKVSFDLLR